MYMYIYKWHACLGSYENGLLQLQLDFHLLLQLQLDFQLRLQLDLFFQHQLFPQLQVISPNQALTLQCFFDIDPHRLLKGLHWCRINL